MKKKRRCCAAFFLIFSLSAIGFTISAYVLGTPLIDAIRNMACTVGSLISLITTGNGAIINEDLTYDPLSFPNNKFCWLS